MACFIVPMVEAVATTVTTKVLESKAKEQEVEGTQPVMRVHAAAKKFRVLSNLLWGGSALLAFEHLWHGEIVPWFPFLTAASNPVDAAQMLHEMSTIGVAMALLVTAIWGVGCLITHSMEKKEEAVTERIEK
jgi:hypothetical protein